MGLPGDASFKKKQTVPPGGLNATSPLRNDFFGLSRAPATRVPTQTPPGMECKFPPTGSARKSSPTVRGARCLLSRAEAREPPSRIGSETLDTKSGRRVIGLYNRFRGMRRLSESEAPEPDATLAKAIDAYRKLAEDRDLSDAEKQAMDQRVKDMTEREVIDENAKHEPVEISGDAVAIGPPVLTRFEKARIMGARALQLSLGAPPFVEIPATAKRSLDIAMEELEKKIIPIVIKRVLPNGDYQNLPIDRFK